MAEAVNLHGDVSAPAGVQSFWVPLLQSLAAGSATTVGGLVVFALRGAPNPRTVAFFVAFAAGVMAVVSVVDLWAPQLTSLFSGALATAWLAAGFFGSAGLSRLDLPGAEAMLAPLMGAALGSSGADKGAAPGSLGDSGGGDDSPLPDAGALPAGHDIELGRASGAAASSSGSAMTPSHRQRSADSAAAGPLVAGVGVSGSSIAVAPTQGLPQHSTLHSFAPASARPGAAAPAASPPPGASALRLGALVCLALTAHNFPEGLGVLAAGTKSARQGTVVAAAIAIHNIAEGFCVAVPIWAGTGSRWLALAMTAASGMSEPLGALAGGLLLRQWGGAAASVDAVLNALLCAVGGVMVYVASRELLPEALSLVRGDAGYVARCFAAGAAVILAAMTLL